MKIAFFHHTLYLGTGIDTVIWELAKRLSRHNDVSILTFKSELTKSSINDVNIIELPIKDRNLRALFPITRLKQLKKILNTEKYDVINTHLYPANVLTNLLRPKTTKHIYIEWGTPIHLKERFIKEHSFLYFLYHANKYACKKSDATLVSSNFLKNWVAKNYGVQSEKLIIDGVNLDLFSPEKISQELLENMRTKYGLSEHNKILLFVGRVAPSKGIENLIKMLFHLRKKHPEIKLLIVGRTNYLPSYYKYLKKLILNLNLNNQIVFTGAVGWISLVSCYALCDVYVTGTLWEGFLRAEALAMEKPMVAFNIPPNDETIINGETGYLVKPFDINDFARKVGILLEDEELRRKMGVCGRNFVKKNLSFDVIARRFEDYLIHCVEK